MWGADSSFGNMQVLQARRRLDKGVQDAKEQVRAYLKQHGLTAPLAKEPFVTGILYAIVVLPLIVAVPLINLVTGTPLGLQYAATLLMHHHFPLLS